jgi:hypothetical protein
VQLLIAIIFSLSREPLHVACSCECTLDKKGEGGPVVGCYYFGGNSETYSPNPIVERYVVEKQAGNEQRTTT